ncbi:pirin-like C-terminal cupin domain-containing protein [Vulgatibacter incomptus]|uniref:Pirin n=1 Tax=Vulgatibacter incomptus TaxID=1391653 RepID=A0A0K1PGI1_9BACT|nr:Pirin [Vulgatibacter incomptus]
MHAGQRDAPETCLRDQLTAVKGVALDEPVVQYGPFVMNTMAEIQQAMMDVRSGKFGYLE